MLASAMMSLTLRRSPRSTSTRAFPLSQLRTGTHQAACALGRRENRVTRHRLTSFMVFILSSFIGRFFRGRWDGHSFRRECPETPRTVPEVFFRKLRKL